MKKNKGIIGLGLIVVIVLGIAVVGGGAYYLGTNKSVNKKIVENPLVENQKEENNQLEENQNKKNEVGGPSDIETLVWPNQKASNNCTNIDGVAAPILLLPNGGENFTPGQKITVKWKSCVPESLSMGSVGLFIYMQSQVPSSGNTFGLGYELAHITPDDGFTEVILPTKDQWKEMEYGKNFKIQIWHPQYQSIANPMDYSDGLFTINSPSAINNNLIKLTSCGVSFSKTSEWSVISNTANEIKLDIPGDTHTGFAGIDIKCVLSNTITDTDAKFGNITYFYDIGKKAWMETDNREGEGIAPNSIPVLAKPLFTTADGFLVFRGTGRWLTYIVPISPNSILSLREGDTEGGYTQTLTNLVKTIKKL